jgi:hypothetical protein
MPYNLSNVQSLLHQEAARPCKGQDHSCTTEQHNGTRKLVCDGLILEAATCPVSPRRNAVARVDALGTCQQSRREVPAHLAAVLYALDVDASFVAAQVAAMGEVQYAKTSNRSVLGIMNQFSYLAEGYREYLETSDLLELSLKLAHVPCSPLYKRETFPDRELRRWILNYRANSVEEASKP